MREFIDISLGMAHDLKPTVVVIFADNVHFIKDCMEKLLKENAFRIIIVTRDTYRNREGLIETNDKLRYHFITQPVLAEMALLPQLNDLMIELCSTGVIRTDDRVMCIVYGEIFITMYLRPGDISIVRLMDELKERIDIRILQKVIELGTEIAREGKEGVHKGALFVLGDVDTVISNSFEGMKNPFHGHDERDRNILNINNSHDPRWKAMKEFAQMDGASVIDESGTFRYAGRWLKIDWEVLLRTDDRVFHTGTRHQASASITKNTRAIAVLVSSEGRVTVFKDGVIIMDMAIR